MSSFAGLWQRVTRPSGGLVAGLFAATLIYALFVIAPDRSQGDIQRIMYLHVPSAWLAYLAFLVTFAASVRYLLGRALAADRLAAASAEVGLVFTGIAIVTGAIWGKATWGVWWDWDPRLTTTALLFLLYLGYALLRASVTDRERRARLSAVLGVLAFANVPVVHFSVLWWRGLHQGPSVIRPDQPAIATPLLATLLVNVIAFTLLFVWLTRRRQRLDELADETAALIVGGR